MATYGILWTLVLGACLAPPGSPPAQDEGTLPEYVVKAGFLFNFAKYVEWPPEAFDKADSPILIGIVGMDPFGEELDRMLRNKTVKERSLIVRRFREPAEIQSCHILFVPRTEGGRLSETFKVVETRPVLTVGEDEGFARAGGMVGILIEKEKPKLEVNQEAAQKAHLTINSKLLKVATIVRTSR